MNARSSMSLVTRSRPGVHGAQRTRLLVADDHALLRQALLMVLEAQDSLEVVGEATNGRDAVDAAERLMPDVVLMDMVMPGLNGIDATRQIMQRAPGVRVLILTAYLDDELVVGRPFLLPRIARRWHTCTDRPRRHQPSDGELHQARSSAALPRPTDNMRSRPSLGSRR